MSKRSLGPPPRMWLADAEEREARPGGWRNSPFGHADHPGWKEAPADPKERAAFEAALTQHRLSQSIRSLIRRQQTNTQVVSGGVGISVDGLRRILSGAKHLSLTDLHRIAAMLERDVEIRLRDPRKKAANSEKGAGSRT